MSNKIKREGFPIDIGYVGFINGKRMLFETEDAYNDYIADLEKEEENEDAS